MKIPLVDLHKQVETVKPAIMSKISSLLDSTSFIMGQTVTYAFVLILEAFGIGAGDEVITPPFTYFATADSISRIGAVPVFVDVEKASFNMDVNLIEAANTKKTKAILRAPYIWATR